MAREYIYTGSGGAPVSYETDAPLSTPEQDAILGARFLGFGAGAAASPAMFLDMPGYAARFLSKVPQWVDKYIDPFDIGVEARAAGDGKLLGQDFAARVEEFAPRDYFTKKAQDLILGGKREHFIEQGGELPFTLGGIAGGIGGLFSLAKAAPKTFKALDLFTDVMTGTPSQQMMQSANTLPKIIGAGAGVGLASSVVPAGDVGFNPATGQFDLPAAGTMLAAGAGLGAGIPAVIGGAALLPQVGQGVKGMLDNIVQGAGQMIKQSDNIKLYKEVKQAQVQREQMAQFAKAQEAEVTKAYAPEVQAAPEVPKIEKTFAKKVPSYEEQPNIQKMQQEDLLRLADDEAKLSKQLETTTTKYEDEINTLSSYIEEAKAKPVEVADTEVNAGLKGPKTQREVVDELRAARTEEIKAERTPIKEQIDTAMSKQMILKEKEKNLAKLIKEKTPEELQKEFGKPIEKVQATVQKDLEKNEIAIGKLQKKLDKIDARLEKTVPVKRTEVEARMAEINQERDKLRQELLQQKEAEKQKLIEELETEADNVFNRYDDEKAKYQDQLAKIQKQRAEVEGFAPKPQLPAVIEKAPEVSQPKPRFISGRQGIKEYDPQTGLPVPVKEITAPHEQVGVTPEGDIIVPPQAPQKTAVEQLADNFGAALSLDASRPKSRTISVMRSAISKQSEYLGGKFAGHQADYKLAEGELKTKATKLNLHRSMMKYQNDDVVMANLGNASLESQKIATLNNKIDNLTDPEKILAAKTQLQETMRKFVDYKSQLPEDLRVAVEAIQPTVKDIAQIPIKHGYDIQLSDFYFPFRVGDFKLLAEASGDAKAAIKQYLGEINKAIDPTSGKQASLDDLSVEQLAILDERLQKQKTVARYTPEMMKAYKSMPEAYDIFSRQMATAYADSKLFQGDLNDMGENFAKLILDAHADKALTPKQADKLLRYMTTYFGARGYIPPVAYKFISNSISTFLITGLKTSVAQFTSILSNLRKSGVLETAESIDHILKVLDGKRDPFTLKLNPGATMGTVNDVVVDSLSNIRDVLTGQYQFNKRTNALQKAGQATETTLYAPLQASDWVEKEVTFAANYSWLKNNVGKKNYVASFKDRYKSAFSPEEWNQLEKELVGLKKHRPQELSDLVYKAVDLRAGEQLVTGSLDKTGLALGNTFERMTMQLQSYAMKFADEIDLTTRRMAAKGIAEYQEGVKTGNKELKSKGLDKIKDAGVAALSIAAVLPAWTAYASWRMGDSFEQIKSKALDFGGNARTLLTQTFPVTWRGLKGVSDLRTRATGHADTLVNTINPGLGTTARIYGDTLATLAKGKHPWTEENPSWKYMPPRALSEAFYNASETASERKRRAREAKSPTLQLQKQVEFAKQLDNMGLLNPETATKLGDAEFKSEIRKLRTKMSRIEQYGTTDPELVGEIKIKLASFDQAERQFLSYLEAKRRNGQLTNTQYQQALKTKNERIMKMLDQLYKAGKI